MDFEKEPFTRGELEVLNFLWDSNEPLSPWEIEDRWTESTWSASHIRHLLTGLEKKGAVECCGAEKRGRQYSRRFRCTFSQEEYYTSIAMSKGITTEKFFQAEAVALLKKGGKEDMEKLVDKLEEILKEFRRRIDDNNEGDK